MKKRKTGKRFILVSAVIASMLGTSILPAMAASPEDGLPQVTVDQVVWDGNELVIPIDLGDYADDDVYMNVYTVEGTEDSWSAYDYIYPTISDDGTTASVSRWDDYENCETEMKYSKAGTYQVEVEFYTMNDMFEDNTILSTDQLEIVVNEDNELWNVEYEKVPFDGSQDINFRFKNGTNAFQLKTITGYSIFAFFTDAMDSGELISEGFDFDMDAGMITFDKDVLKKAITDLTDDKTYISNAEVALNIYALTDDGTEVQLDLLDGRDSSFSSRQSWWLDITDLDWNDEQPDEPKPSVPTVGFDGVDFPGASIAPADGQVIADSALDFVQENYADMLATLGDDYTVISRLVLSEVDEKNIPQSVQVALEGVAEDKNIGQYYDISVLADVVKDGKTVSGLENIEVTNLKDDISISLNIPENLVKDGRIFAMLHYHNGQASMLETSETDSMITFQTGAFSTYALAYADRQEDSNETGDIPKIPENIPEIPENVPDSAQKIPNDTANVTDSIQNDENGSETPKTGDEHGMFAVVAVIAGCAAIASAVIGLKRRIG